MSAAAAPTSPAPGAPAAPRHPWLWRLVELAGVFALAVARPDLELAADTPEFFTVRDASDAAIVVFAIALIAAVPLLLLGLEALADRLRSGLGERVHGVLLAVLLGALAVPFLVRLTDGAGITGWLLLAAALAIGVAATVAARRWVPTRSFLRALGFAPPIVLALFLADAPLGGANATDGLRVARPAPIVVVIFDEFPAASLYDRDGTVSRTRMPTFARLAREGTLWADATSPADTTPHAVPSLLGGAPPRIGRTPNLDTWPRNLFTLLRGQYDISALEPVTNLCPRETCPDDQTGGITTLFGDADRLALRAIAPPDLRTHLPPVIGEEGTLTDPDAQIDTFLGRLTDGDRPSLRMLHVLLPHHPWTHLADGEEYALPNDRADKLPEGYEDRRWTEDAAVVARNRRRHLAQVSYADRVLGKIVARLERTGRYDDTLLVVAADHGVSFRPGGAVRDATRRNAGEIVSVPLLMKRPGQRRGGVVTGQAELTHVLPTILDVLGAPAADRRGSLLSPRPADADLAVASSAGGATTLRLRLSEIRRQREAVIATQPEPWTKADTAAASRSGP